MFNGFEPRNTEKTGFDRLEDDELKGYVYALKDPRDGKIFYAGQGSKNRVFDHFQEAKKFLNSPQGKPSVKILRIIEIWAAEEDVEWMILSCGHNEENGVLDAIESAVIDTLAHSQNGPALNAELGPKSTFHDEMYLKKLVFF